MVSLKGYEFSEGLDTAYTSQSYYQSQSTPPDVAVSYKLLVLSNPVWFSLRANVYMLMTVS